MEKKIATVTCPKSMVGRVIGKNGETIRALQHYSGAQIQIDQSSDPMKVTITGVQRSLDYAISMVTDIVNGNFKGFAMLRQFASDQVKLEALAAKPKYAPGYGLIPPSHIQSSVNQDLAQGPTVQLPSGSTEEDTTSLQILSLAQRGMRGVEMMDGLTTAGGSCTSASLEAMGGGLLGPLSTVDTPLVDSSVSPLKRVGMERSSCFGVFPELRNGGGSLSPELSCGWSNNTLLNELSSGFETRNLLNELPSSASCRSPLMDHDATQLHRLSDYVTASTGGSFSDASEPATNGLETAGTGIGGIAHLRRSGNENIMFLLDPHGRPFTVNLTTGETQWLDGITENRGGLLQAAAFKQALF